MCHTASQILFEPTFLFNSFSPSYPFRCDSDFNMEATLLATWVPSSRFRFRPHCRFRFDFTSTFTSISSLFEFTLASLLVRFRPHLDVIANSLSHKNRCQSNFTLELMSIAIALFALSHRLSTSLRLYFRVHFAFTSVSTTTSKIASCQAKGNICLPHCDDLYDDS